MSLLPSHPAIWREPLAALELMRLVRDPMFTTEGGAPGGGRPVLLIPGFLAGDGSLALMTAWLRRSGHWTSRAGIRANVDCSTATVDRLAVRLRRLVERRGERATIIGQSRGGTMSRVLAVRHPELVAGIVNLGAPILSPFSVHPFARAGIGVVGRLGSAGAPGFFRHDCRGGECCEPFRLDMSADIAPEVDYLSIYSRSDGIVDWRTCLDPAARHLEVSGTHSGMGVNVDVYHALAAELSRDRHQPPRPAETGPALAAAA